MKATKLNLIGSGLAIGAAVGILASQLFNFDIIAGIIIGAIAGLIIGNIISFLVKGRRTE